MQVLKDSVGVAGVGAEEQAQQTVGVVEPRTGCGSDGVSPSDRLITAGQVAAVRDQLERRDLAAYIVPYSDEHQVDTPRLLDF